MDYNTVAKRRGDDRSKGWFRSLVGNVLLSIAGGLALLFLACLIFSVKNVPWWVSIVGLVVSGLVALAGDRMRTRKIYVDQGTGQVRKNNL
jgi:membrane-associated phospholipid phosphatase